MNFGMENRMNVHGVVKNFSWIINQVKNIHPYAAIRAQCPIFQNA